MLESLVHNKQVAPFVLLLILCNYGGIELYNVCYLTDEMRKNGLPT